MQRKVYVGERGFHLAAGPNATDLLAAVLAELPLAQNVEDIYLQRRDDERIHHPWLCFLPDVADEKQLVLQMQQQMHCLAQYLEQHDRLYLLLPEPGEPSYEQLLIHLDLSTLPDGCQVIMPRQLPELLVNGVAEIQSGQLNSLILFGLDSLTNFVSIQHYFQRNLLRTQHLPDRQILGQGWAWFTLTGDQSINQPGAIWQGSAGKQLDVLEQQHNGQNLAACIQQVLQGQDLSRMRPLTWVHTGQTPESDLEIYMAHRQCWSSASHDYAQIQQLMMARTLGNLGAASLPAMVNLACERLNFPPQPASELLLLDIQQRTVRMVAHLLHPTNVQV